MPIFTYQAINESGADIAGTMEADSADTVSNTLSNRGLIPLKIMEQKRFRTGALQNLFDRLRPVKAPELILFTKQFRTMIKAGVPMMILLQTLESQTENTRLRRIITDMTQEISEGSSLYESFRKYPGVFSSLYCSMVRAGETSGALPAVLDRLIYIIEHNYKIRSDIRATLQYPIIVILFLILSFFVMLTGVIPKFSSFFAKAGIPLPLLTRLCVSLYDFLSDYWPVLILGGIGAAAVTTLYLRSNRGRFHRDTLLLKLPLLGALFQKAAMARFASIFSILQSSGVAVLESMEILAQTINNKAIAAELVKISERLEEGRGISGPLRQSRYFTPIVINMTAIGEESGNLEQMLNDTADHYDSELSFAMKRLSDSLGPMLTVGLAIVVGLFALAVYLPMIDYSTTIR